MANLGINCLINTNLNCREDNLLKLNGKAPTEANPDLDLGGRYGDTKLENLGVIYDTILDITKIGTCYSESEACPWDWPHCGIDFCFYNESKIIAAASGQVERIGVTEMTGDEEAFYTINMGIRFNESIVIEYGFEPGTQDEADVDHQKRLFKVQEGDWLDKGDEIATFLSIEDNGHIHFGVTENDVWVCPVKYYSTDTCEELLNLLHSNPATADWKLHYHDYDNIPFEPEPTFPNENFIWDFPRWRILAYKTYFEGEGMPAEYKELFKALAPIKYYKITEAPLLTNYNDNYYGVQLQELYYDPFWNVGTASHLKHKLRPIENRPKLNVSVINFTNPVIDADASFSPILLREIPFKENIDLLLNLFIPKNGTKLALDWSAEQLNLTYSRSQIFASQEGTKLEIDFEKNKIFVNDTSSDAYVRLKYDDRGILSSGEIYFNCTELFHGTDEWILINTTRIYDELDPFDGIDWAYDLDDKNTFNLISKDVIHDNKETIEIEITNISNIFINFTSEDWGWFLKNIPIQILQANISIPDSGTVENVIIGSASEYVPQVIWKEIEDYLYIGDNMLPHFLLNPKEFNGKYMGLLRALKTDDYVVEYGTNWYKLLDSSTGNYSIIKYFADGTLQYIYSADKKMILGDTSEDEPLFLYPEEIPVNITELTKELVVNEIEFGPTGADDINIALNISVSANKTLIYSGFTKQSVQTSIDNVLFYIDLWLNDTINLNLPINITIKYDDVNLWWLKDLNLWWFNESGNNRKGKWELVDDCIDLGYGKLKGSVDRTGVFAITLNPDPEIIWDFNIGDIIGWRTELYINDTLFNYYDVIFNISALAYDIIDDFTRFYVVKLAQMFFNPNINAIEELTDCPTQDASKINFNDAIMESGDIPGINLFIPNNGTGLALHWCANALNSSYSSIMNTNMLTFKIKDNEILYTDTTSNSYVNLKYYENGTLETGELFVEDMWNPEIGNFDGTLNYTRIFDFNPLDDLEWTVDIGDVFYCGVSFIGSSGDDIELIKQKIEIVDILNITISLDTVFDNIQVITPIQEVRANTSFWDNSSKAWMQLAENITICSANELYPIYKVGDMIPILVPIGTTGAEFAMLSRMTMFSTPEIEVSCGDYSIKILNSTNKGYISIEFFPDGLIKYIHSEKFMPYGDCVIYYLNNKTINGQFDFEIEPYGTNDFDVYVNISVFEDTLLLFASFHKNPTKTTLSNDLLFIDIFLNNTDHLNPPVNITIEYNYDKYKDYEITILRYNRSAKDGEGGWEIVEFTDLGNCKIFISVDHTSIFALIGTESEPEFPVKDGDDNGGDGKKPAEDVSFVIIIAIAGSIAGALGIIGVAILIIKKKRI